MKKYFFLLLLLAAGSIGFAQADTSLLYLRFPTVPPFSIINVADSSKFSIQDLAKKKPVIIIVFSPDCEHCQHETRELIAHKALFKKAQIIMSSPLDYSLIKKFYEDYGVAACTNITMGRDPGYFLGTFYKVRSLPAIFVYDKKGNFVKAFDGSIPVEKIAEAL